MEPPSHPFEASRIFFIKRWFKGVEYVLHLLMNPKERELAEAAAEESNMYVYARPIIQRIAAGEELDLADKIIFKKWADACERHRKARIAIHGEEAG